MTRIRRRERRSRVRTTSFPTAAAPRRRNCARTRASMPSSGSCGGRRRTGSTASRTQQTRLIGADESGFLYGSAQIFLFVLAVGAFITIAMKTGAIEAGIGRLATRFGKRRLLLVLVLMSVFALGGTTYGMWEETLGFYALMVPLVLALGYDRVVAVGIIAVGAGTGVLASTVNPFATGVASDAAGISISDGIGLRVLMLLILAPVGIAYVMFYAQRFGARKEAPVATAAVAGSGGGVLLDDGTSGDEPPVAEVPPLTGSQKIVLMIFGLAFAIMIYGFVPWEDVWHERLRCRLSAADLQQLLLHRGFDAVHRRRCPDRRRVPHGRGRHGLHDRVGGGRLPQRGPRDRAGTRRHGDHEEQLHHRHDPLLDGACRRLAVGYVVHRSGVDRQHPDRIPRAVLIGARRVW